MNTAYSYDPQTGEYLGAIQYRSDPLDGTAPPPANATVDAPPVSAEKEVAVLIDGAWHLRPDHRGTHFWLPDGSQHTITAIGQTVPDDASSTPSATFLITRAYGQIDSEHARLLEGLTGDATAAERDTWVVKSTAATAMIAGMSTAEQASMIEVEAEARGVSAAALAETISAKASAYQTAVGQAGALRARARRDVEAADASDAEAQIDAVIAALRSDIDTILGDAS